MLWENIFQLFPILQLFQVMIMVILYGESKMIHTRYKEQILIFIMR